MPLTHYALLHAQPREKIYKLFDGHAGRKPLFRAPREWR